MYEIKRSSPWQSTPNSAVLECLPFRFPIENGYNYGTQYESEQKGQGELPAAVFGPIFRLLTAAHL